ncbi:MAG: sensor histidine kinase, partial [Actinomadura sp.]
MSSFRQSLRARLTLVAGVFAGLACAIVTVLVLVDVHAMEARLQHEQVTEAIDRAKHHIRLRAFPRTLAWSGDEAIQVLDPAGRIRTGTPQVAGKPPMATFLPAGDRLRAKWTLCPPAGLEGCMNVVAYRSYQPDGAWLVYVASPTIPWYANSTLA